MARWPSSGSGGPETDPIATALTAATGKGFVAHGATAAALRPVGFASVEWHGTVAPTNAVTGDTWVRV